MADPVDRQVHATLLDGSTIVRYDRSGRWYQEWPLERMIPHRPLLIRDAVRLTAGAVHIHFGLPGGQTFDREVRRQCRDWALENGDHSE